MENCGISSNLKFIEFNTTFFADILHIFDLFYVIFGMFRFIFFKENQKLQKIEKHGPQNATINEGNMEWMEKIETFQYVRKNIQRERKKKQTRNRTKNNEIKTKEKCNWIFFFEKFNWKTNKFSWKNNDHISLMSVMCSLNTEQWHTHRSFQQ